MVVCEFLSLKQGFLFLFPQIKDPDEAEEHGLNPELFDTYKAVHIHLESACKNLPEVFWINSSAEAAEAIGKYTVSFCSNSSL